MLWNGWPTGIAVTYAMHHGGPYPATTAPLHTSVGTTALRRFLRPVAYQNMPQRLLPEALRDGNPLGIPRAAGRRAHAAALAPHRVALHAARVGGRAEQAGLQVPGDGRHPAERPRLDRGHLVAAPAELARTELSTRDSTTSSVPVARG